MTAAWFVAKNGKMFVKKSLKSDADRLVELYGKLLGAGKMDAPQRVIARFQNAYQAKLREVQSRYPDSNFGPRFEDQIRQRAESWLRNQAFFGPGRDW